MSVQKQKYQAYAAATQTAARTRQIVMLYDGMIRFLQQARDAVREKRIEDRYHLLTKVSNIIAGLQGCLDFEHGGDIAHVLYSFYSTVDNRIFSIYRSNSLVTCDEVLADLKQMRDVWQEIDQKNTAATGENTETFSSASEASGSSDQNITLSA